MAGGTGSIQREPAPKRGSLATKRKKKKRVGFTLDMTPLVDIAFLLLTFFMFTTTMAQPQVMEMKIPPQETEVEVKESKLLTLRVREDGKIFYNMGQDEPEEVAIEDLSKLAVAKNMEVRNELITALKISRASTYGLLVEILDQLNLAESEITSQLSIENIERKRKFALVSMTEEEIAEIEAL